MHLFQSYFPFICQVLVYRHILYSLTQHNHDLLHKKVFDFIYTFTLGFSNNLLNNDQLKTIFVFENCPERFAMASAIL